MNHPLAIISPDKRKPVFLLFLGPTLILFAVFRILDVPLRTPAAPNGIVSFELAGDIRPAADILASWDARAELFAAFGIGLDYLFMPAYALALSLGVLLASSRHPGGFAKLGAWLGWGALVAPFFDAVENYGLLHLLLSSLTSLWPLVSSVCATVKFALLVLGLVYALVGWLWPKAG